MPSLGLQSRGSTERLVLASAGAVDRRRSVVVLDATNILARSFTKSPEARQVKPQHAFGLWTEYLASTADVVVGVFDNPANRNKPQSALFPFRSYLESRPNSMMVTSAPGEEADGAIVSIARRLEAFGPGRDVITHVASGDSDLQACLAPRTSWVEILPYPTKSSPGGLVVHGLEDFRWRAYFAPSQYGAFLALRGKEAVKGVGVGDRTAAKLVRAFGTVENMLEVGLGGADGLVGWDAGVRRALEGEAGRARLARNAARFGSLGGSRNDDVADAVAQFVDNCLLTQDRPGRDEGPRMLGDRLHPMFALHFERVRAGAERMMETMPHCTSSWSVTVDGWYVDAVIEDRICVIFVEADGRGGDNEILTGEIVSQAIDGSLASFDPFKLLKKCSEAGMVRYLALVKRHCPRDVLFLPVNRPAAVSPAGS